MSRTETDRSRRRIRCLDIPAAAAAAVMALVLAAPTAAQVQGEFDNQCAMGLSEGQRVDTDCSIRWTSSDGKIYCFSDSESKSAFLKDPQTRLERARAFVATSEVSATIKSMEHYSGTEVKDFLRAEIQASTERNGGVFRLHDNVADQDLELTFVDIDFMRTLHGYGFFPETVFHAKDDPAKKYLIDFWIKPAPGGLAILDTRIYKAPKRDGDGWVLKARSPKPWWWIPASEHPGEVEEKRGWEVMSAVDEHIAAERAKNDGIYVLKDDETGEEIELEYIGIHQPVRRLTGDGTYFACTDFRKADGIAEQIYDIDFWLDEKSGEVRVSEVRVHKVPEEDEGSWRQVPRYSFDDLTFEVVP